MKQLISIARSYGVDVIFVRHDDGVKTNLTKGTIGYQIDEICTLQDKEQIFDKVVNSAFKDLGLLSYLNKIHEKEIMIIGLQSDYCIDANIKSGFEHGFHIVVPAYANTTKDNEFMTGEQSYRYYNEFMWNNRYATCVSMSDAIKKIKKEGKC